MKNRTVCIIGLGYVGLPIAVAFAEKGVRTIAFDINSEKIDMYLRNFDPTNEVGHERLSKLNGGKQGRSITFTADPEALKEADFFIIAVPTPVNKDNTPNLKPITGASETVGKILKKGDVVVYESTVYPGVTEEICAPILESFSGMKCGADFKIGYSPERINPADSAHKLQNIIKVVSGMDQESLDIIADVYSLVVEAGVYKAESIKVAEAAKVIENSQRDINIAFMNELSIIFDRMGIDTRAVLQAAGTKWNFIKFTPGLVGGHCIGVDPYYLTYKAQMLGYSPQVILSGRSINDNMGKHIAEKAVKKMIEANIQIKGSRVAVLGLTFKENCGDLRNSKVVDIINELHEYGIITLVTDCNADAEEAYKEHGLSLVDMDRIFDVDAVIIAVAHDTYKNLRLEKISQMFCSAENRKKVLIDVKGVFDRKAAEEEFVYWRL